MGSVQRIDHRGTLWVLLIRCFKWVTLHRFSWVMRKWEMAFSNPMNFRGTAGRQLRALRVRHLRHFLTPKTYTENALSLWTVSRLLVAATSWKVWIFSAASRNQAFVYWLYFTVSITYRICMFFLKGRTSPFQGLFWPFYQESSTLTPWFDY